MHRDELHDVPPSLHGMVLPLRPQRHPGFLSVIRYPAIICHPQGLASVAVGIDLTHVGGHFFACVLPATLSYEELEAYVRPHTWHVDTPLLFYIGVHRDPWQTGRAFSLRNAEVITVLSNPDAHFHRGIAPELFMPTAVWSPIRHLPRMAPFAGYCVICGEDRFFLRPHYHYGVTMLEAIARMLQVDVSAITTCFFPSSDMAMHGNDCLGIVMVKKLPNPVTDSQQAGRRDVFTHIDCRALGVRSHVVHSHFPALHLPSVAACLDLKVPPHFRLCAAGGRVSGEDVYVQGHSTLILYVVDESDEDSDLPGSDPGAGRPIPSMQSDRSRSRSRESSSAQQAVGEIGQSHQAQEHPPVSAPLPGSAASCAVTDQAPTLSTAVASTALLWSGDPAKPLPTCDISSRGFLEKSSAPSQPETLESADIPLAVCWNVLQCKGPAAPTNAQQAAINTLVYHGETHLLPAPLHRLGDEPPGQAVAPVAVASEGEDDTAEEVESYQATFQLFAVGCAPLALQLEVGTPNNVDYVLDALAVQAATSRYAAFPRLVAASPQPYQGWGCVLAFPAWSHREPVVLFDLRDIDGRSFAGAVPSPFSKEQIMRAASLPYDLEVEVFPFGSPHPMTREDLVDVQEAGCVTFKPIGAVWVVHGTTLQLMLWNPYAWSPNPAFPAPPLGSRFCVVVDDGGCRLVPSTTPDELPVDVVAEALGVDPRSLVLQPATPPVHDAVFNGYPCNNVVVAFRGAPVTSPAFVAALFDCRPLMLGWDSFTTDDGRLLHEQVLDWFDTFCPDAWHAALLEVDVFHGVFMVAPGQVVQVVYMPDGSSSDSARSGDASSHDDDPANAPSEDASSTSGSHSVQGSAPTRLHDSRERSRSPNRPAAREPGPQSACLAIDEPLNKALLATEATSILTSPCTRIAPQSYCDRLGVEHYWEPSPFYLSSLPGEPFAVCKLLLEPVASSVSQQRDLDDLRALAEHMGLPWPYFHLPDVREALGMEPIFETQIQVHVPTTLHFAVLTPDYTPERIRVGIMLPADMDLVTRQVQAARDPERAGMFPHLLSAVPQPTSNWGLLVAQPAWSPRALVIVCDLLAVDGRIFAVHAPASATREDLLWLADVPPGADINVVAGFDARPLRQRQEVRLLPGQCITYVPSTILPPSVRTLDSMLLTPHTWINTQAFPSTAGTNCYAVAMDTWHRLFVADAYRPWAFRRDLAVELGIAIGRLRVVQAHPPVQDALHQGFTCRTTVGADETGPDELDASVLVILDCKPISQGWMVYRAPWGYLNLRLLAASFGGSTPLFWRLEVVGHAPIQHYVAVNPGDVFTLVYVWDEDDLGSSATLAVGRPPLGPPDDARPVDEMASVSCVAGLVSETDTAGWVSESTGHRLFPAHASSSRDACLPHGPHALRGLRRWGKWMAGCPRMRPLRSCGALLHSTRCSPYRACGSRVIKWAGIFIRSACCPGIPWPTSVLLPRGTYGRASPFSCWPSILVIVMRCLLPFAM